MQLSVTPAAAKWFRDNVGLPKGSPDAGIRFKAQLHGNSPAGAGFSLRIEPNVPHEVHAQYQADDGLLFFIEESDTWMFDGHDLVVDLDADADEPKYSYTK